MIGPIIAIEADYRAAMFVRSAAGRVYRHDCRLNPRRFTPSFSSFGCVEGRGKTPTNFA